jgi:chorismate mutase / prephenate dehydrogenase
MTEDKGKSLKALRNELDRIDRELVERAAERQRIVSEIGRLKKSVGRQLRDFRRERQVLDGVRAHAEHSGLDPDVAERLLTTLIEASLTRQETERVALSARGEGRRALVIGGCGRMGRWLVRFLDSQGFDVLIADAAVTSDGRREFSDWRAAPLDVDLIVVAAPIDATRRIIDELAGLGSPGLVFDVASIKAPLVDSLRRAGDAGLNICSVHPMFGPDTRLLAGHHVLLADCGNASAVNQARALFDETMASLVDVSLDAHDRLMAWVLGLSHALNVAFSAALADSDMDAGQLAAISSTTFQRQLDIATDVTAENPELYFEIQRLNPYEPGVLRALRNTLASLEASVLQGDAQTFVGLMQRGAGWTGRHRTARAGETADDGHD